MGLSFGFAAALVAALGALAPSLVAAASCASTCDWGYAPNNGPAIWGSLCCPVCDGSSQSPVDIRPGEALGAEAGALALAYEESHLEFFNTGRTLELAYELEDADNTLTVGEWVYDFEGLHFHSLSEHTVEGRHAPLEMHLVHRRTSYDVAVVAVLIEEGPTVPAFLPMWNSLPADSTVERRTVILDPGKLLPERLAYYSYRGSLTVPNCAETVTWFVLAEPVFMQRDQIEKFRAIFSDNYRPTQPLNGRSITTHDE